MFHNATQRMHLNIFKKRKITKTDKTNNMKAIMPGIFYFYSIKGVLNLLKIINIQEVGLMLGKG